MKRKLRNVFLALLACGTLFSAAACSTIQNESPAALCKLVENRNVAAEIVLDFSRQHWRADGPHGFEPEDYAARELQSWIGSITGSFVPIVAKPTANRAVRTRLFVGTNFAKDRFKDDLKKMRGSDGFAVRTTVGEDGVRNIYLFGSISRGTLHSVYEFLERNSDIIWARPNEELGTIYSETPDFTVVDADFLCLPKSDFRAFQWIYHTPARQDYEWQSRNRMNRLGGHARYGGTFTNAGVGHGIQVYVPHKVYFKDHPEYYTMMESGKRDYRNGQICLLAYEMIPEYVKNMRADLAKKFNHLPRPEQGRVDYFNLSIADNWGVCKCPKCLAPFKTENGRIIQPEDPVFRSAQYYTFINKVAREIRKTNPNVTVGVYAYVFTSEPPPFPLEQNVRIEYCPFVLNEKTPIYDIETNGKWNDYLIGWGKASKHTQVREYLGWANKFPRSQAYRVRDNGLFYIKHNVKEFSAEHPLDSGSKAYPPAIQTWDVSGMDAWLIARMWWDATQDLEKLREQYLTRTYREAAPQMKLYYDTLRDSFYSNKLASVYSDDMLPLISAYIMKPGLDGKLRGYLEDALKAAKHPKSRELIARQLKHLNDWIEMAKNDKTVRATVPVVKGMKENEIMQSFGSKIWDNAGATGDFVVADQGPDHGKKAKFRSTARLLHDRENLYIYFQCFTPDMKNLAVSRTKDRSVESIPRGDIMEFFLGHASNGVYYQFMFDAGNPGQPELDVVYDGKGYTNSWTCDWKRSVKRYDDRWEAIVKIPLAAIELNVTQNNKLLFQPIRGKYYDTVKNGKPAREREMASWNGGWVHQMPAFGELTLNQD